ncbi:hypothetical protein TBLA_0G03450 [Henningerozyma blattae CBS 6284]|uniref:non-specific serine/threonine protein kinase n=1 Tax=Henningerozyma blattae (strain ATCC 34711 / CBS 6284 / DSM 70876 / NBRC 10599 / NRRL Y-10934 / UCD 77-7) TaxID=1071380 RepID=I2H7C9_HENB6|nr:hypothetical protein TBLA_0G03450 [Tetrapisispora blattae CBS 6284]CCH62281.1 hypothetical protein TBLA_0G03450 [Tetrapisispora blattae CBS 6284]
MLVTASSPTDSDSTTSKNSNSNSNLKRSDSNSSTNSSSSNISSDYDNYLRIATDKNPCILLELELDGSIRYISKLWYSLISKQSPKNISNVIISDNHQDLMVFQTVMRMMLTNKNACYTVTFNVAKDDKKIHENINENPIDYECNESTFRKSSIALSSTVQQDNITTLEACGILLNNNDKDSKPYSMWIVKPYFQEWYNNGDLTNILPQDFIKNLGFGATIFAEYLNKLETLGIVDESQLPDPNMELCRVCELFVPDWWLETHSQLCICEHKIQSRLQLLHDNLIEQYSLLENVENLHEYKGIKLDPHPLNIPERFRTLLMKLCQFAIDLNLTDSRRIEIENMFAPSPIQLQQYFSNPNSNPHSNSNSNSNSTTNLLRKQLSNSILNAKKGALETTSNQVQDLSREDNSKIPVSRPHLRSYQSSESNSPSPYQQVHKKQKENSKYDSRKHNTNSNDNNTIETKLLNHGNVLLPTRSTLNLPTISNFIPHSESLSPQAIPNDKRTNKNLNNINTTLEEPFHSNTISDSNINSETLENPFCSNGFTENTKTYIDEIQNWKNILNEKCCPNDNDNNTNNENTFYSILEGKICKLNELQDPNVRTLAQDTLNLARDKIDAILRLDNSMIYSLKLKNQINMHVIQLIREQLNKNRQQSVVTINNSNSTQSFNSIIHNSQNVNFNIIDADRTIIDDSSHSNSNINNEYNYMTDDEDHEFLNSSNISSTLYYPQPKRLQHEIFSRAYLQDDAIPNNKSKTHRTLSNKSTKSIASSTDNEKQFNSKSINNKNNNNSKNNKLNNKNNNDNDNDNNNDNNINSNIDVQYNHENANSQDTLWQALSRSGSVTPKQQMDFINDSTHNINKGNNSNSCNNSNQQFNLSGQHSNVVSKFLNNTKSSLTSTTTSTPVTYPPNPISLSTPSAFNTPISGSVSMKRSSSALNVPKLKTSIMLTPRRGSPLFTSIVPGQMPNPLTTRSSSSKVSVDRSPVVSPFPSSTKEYLMTPEDRTNSNQFFLNSPKQPLSPLLLATNHIKPPKQSIRDYDIIKPISKGAYGSVFLARKKLTGDHVAIKVLKKNDMIAKNQITNVKSERAIMMVQSNKPYVARLFATFQNKDNLFLVMEYLPGGDLATLIKMMGCLPDKWAKQYLSEVIIGVEDMHKNNIIHHDLKPENLLIDNAGHVKLTDFGLSRAGLVRRHQRAPSRKTLSISSTTSTPTTLPTMQFPNHDTVPENVHTPGSDSRTSNSSTTNSHTMRANSLKESTEHLSNTRLIIDGLMRERERTDSISSTHSNRDWSSMMKRTDSQTSFSFLDISRSSTPPPQSSVPLQQQVFNIPPHTRTNSNISEAVDSNASMDLALFHPESTKQDKKFFGTPDYLAPETIEGTGEDNQCDWWAVGCILFEFLLGYPPFHGKTPEIVFQKILSGSIQWPEFSTSEEEAEFVTPEAKDLILKFLERDPLKRLGSNGATEIKNHPYFKGINWEKVYEETPSFVPTVDNPEDTDYFESRGAILEDLGGDDDSDEDDDIPELFPAADLNSATSPTHDDHTKNSLGFNSVKQHGADLSSPLHKLSISSVLESVSQKNDDNISPTLFKNAPSAIPPHMRERRSTKKLGELQTEFGSFNFRNLSALDKANKDAINRLKSEHLGEHNLNKKLSSVSLPSTSSDISGLKIKTNQHFSSDLSSAQKSSLKSEVSSIYSNSSETRLNTDTAPSSRRGSLINTKSGIHSPTTANIMQFNDIGSDSPSIPKFKSPLSPTINATNSSVFLGTGNSTPNNTFLNNSSSNSDYSPFVNKSRMLSKSSSQRTVGSDAFTDDADKLYAISKVNSFRYRRRSARKSSNGSGIGYHLDVLLCEPIPIHRYKATRDLESLGCTVVSVGAGDELVSRANGVIKFDLIITALKLPKIDAVDIVKLIKQTNGINSLTPIIAATNYTQEAETCHVFNDIMEKPIQLDILRRVVSRYALQKSQIEEDNVLSDMEVI